MTEKQQILRRVREDFPEKVTTNLRFLRMSRVIRFAVGLGRRLGWGRTFQAKKLLL